MGTKEQKESAQKQKEEHLQKINDSYEVVKSFANLLKGTYDRPITSNGVRSPLETMKKCSKRFPNMKFTIVIVAERENIYAEPAMMARPENNQDHYLDSLAKKWADWAANPRSLFPSHEVVSAFAEGIDEAFSGMKDLRDENKRLNEKLDAMARFMPHPMYSMYGRW